MSRPSKRQAASKKAEWTASSPFTSTSVVEEYCFDQSQWASSSTTTEFISFSQKAIFVDIVQMRACPDALEKKLARMRKEWTKVKEEVRFARRRGNHLSESVEESEKKADEMLRELERIDQLVKDLFQGGVQ